LFIIRYSIIVNMLALTRI